MVSVSGVRGIIGQSLFPSTIVNYVGAFCHYLRKKLKEDGINELGSIVLGRDSRVSGPWISSITEGVLQSMGFNVVSCGIVPTPTVQYMVIKLNAIAGIIITSSHNPVQWNGLKFVDCKGLFISPDDCKEIYSIARNPTSIEYPRYNILGSNGTMDVNNIHINDLLSLKELDIESVRNRKFKVCLDTVNGAGGPIMKSLLENLGCEVIALNYETTGIFSHEPEPIPENLFQLSEGVVQHGANLGIATDPDVDRCVLIDENGVPIGEEYTLAICVYFWLKYSGKRGPVCKNLSSSRAVDDIARAFECETFATPVGEIHVAKKMIEVGAVIGGEGNGGVMLPDLHIGRDALVAATLAISALCKENLTLSALKESLPQWYITKKKSRHIRNRRYREKYINNSKSMVTKRSKIK